MAAGGDASAKRGGGAAKSRDGSGKSGGAVKSGNGGGKGKKGSVKKSTGPSRAEQRAERDESISAAMAMLKKQTSAWTSRESAPGMKKQKKVEETNPEAELDEEALATLIEERTAAVEAEEKLRRKQKIVGADVPTGEKSDDEDEGVSSEAVPIESAAPALGVVDFGTDGDDMDLGFGMGAEPLATMTRRKSDSDSDSSESSDSDSDDETPATKQAEAPVQTTESDVAVSAKTDQKPSGERTYASEDVYHLQPKDLSAGADALPLNAREGASKSSSSEIFTRQAFSEMGLAGRLAGVLEGSYDTGGFALTSCTTIQSLCVPLAMSRKEHLLLKSQTGSGKTLAFLIPIFHDLISQSLAAQEKGGAKWDRGMGTCALVISPTRELALQIQSVANQLSKAAIWAVVGSVCGGEKRKSEKARMRKGVVVLVATPGRLLDHLRYTESFRLESLRWVVMDEVDRLLDMGFEQPILEILSRIQGTRLPGLRTLDTDTKVLPDASPEDEDDSTGAGTTAAAGKSGARNLVAKYQQQVARLVKKCSDLSALRYIFASATLPAGVRQLAWPILGGSGGFALIDGDAQAVRHVRSEEELHALAAAAAVAANVPIRQVAVNPEYDKQAFTSAMTGSAASAAPTTALVAGSDQAALPSRLTQFVMTVTLKWRLACLISFLALRKGQKIVVFFATCDEVDYHTLLLREMFWPKDLDPPHEPSTHTPGATGATAGKGARRHLDELDAEVQTRLFGADFPLIRLHGRLTQNERRAAFQRFALQKTGILFCTDVAARGLDMPRVDWILQYDPPCDPADYVHRVGRTARKGEAGSALLFLLPSESAYQTLLADRGLACRTASSQAMLGLVAKEIPGISHLKNADELAAVTLQRRAEVTVAQNSILAQAAAQAYRSHIRAYAVHGGESKAIFRVSALHLGHLAKSFGLLESPKELSAGEKGAKGDVIARIANGEFSTREKETRKSGAVSETKSGGMKATLAAAAASNSNASKTTKKELNPAAAAALKRAMEVVAAAGDDSESDDEPAKKNPKDSNSDDENDNDAESADEDADDSAAAARISVPAFPRMQKRKLSFGTAAMARKSGTKLAPKASGKFRTAGGGYFRKPIAAQEKKKSRAQRAMGEFEA